MTDCSKDPCLATAPLRSANLKPNINPSSDERLAAGREKIGRLMAAAAAAPMIAIPTPTPTTIVPTTERTMKMNAENKTATKPYARPPLHEHGAFDDLYEATTFLQIGGEALEGIAALLLPTLDSGDEQLSKARRVDAHAIFLFFGSAFSLVAGNAVGATERLQRAAKGEIV